VNPQLISVYDVIKIIIALGSIVAVYVRFSNKVTMLQSRVEYLEDRLEKTEIQHDRVLSKLEEIVKMVHEVSIQLTKKQDK
jgi:prefoldin subunit 5